MSRVLYFTAVEIDELGPSGVAKKVIAQCKAFQNYFGAKNVFLSSYVGEEYLVRSLLGGDCAKLHTGTSDKKKLQLKEIYCQLPEFISNEGIDCVYYRCPGLDVFSHTFFKRLREAGVSILLEIPTWPFWQEKRREIAAALRQNPLRGFLKACGAIGYWVESHRLNGLIDGVVTFADVDEIWGCPAIGISNGYDFASVPKVATKRRGNEIRMVVAATLRRNHGIDRAIKSVAHYNGSVPVSLHVAGEGDASDELRLLADDLGVLDSSVFFHGFLQGDKLWKLYSECDVGISALGFHRYGVYDCSPLKTKEYLAAGLPCIGTVSERDMQEGAVSRFFLPIASDDSEFDVNVVVSFINALRLSGVSRTEIRNISRRQFDWLEIMRPVAERFIEAGKEKRT